jgi:hypothetical protein
MSLAIHCITQFSRVSLAKEQDVKATKTEAAHKAEVWLGILLTQYKRFVVH